ncbi:MAG: carbohydrate binding family 9 domain-containing protein [Sediminibacterium magnilacihabitans]|jgi:hypothetical protein|nr:carbohydrate binding family 9 domain-containing protein [Sediminibacterium magnilacihabitans]PQV59952.1 carbohydrate binding protein with CBM9 domain [Sediminibacterium magnilacihabitans]
MRLSTVCWLLPILLSLNTYGQQRDGETFQKEYQVHIARTQEPIQIDGELNEQVWANTQPLSSFWRKFPTDIGKATRKTEARVTYDDKFLYVAFTVYDSGKVFIKSLKRDVGHDGNDCVGLILDPVNKRANGFFFVVNAYNAQSEDQINGNGDMISFSWDNKWYSATKRYADRWTAEMAIPFKTLRYTADKLTWGINFLRVDTKTNEYSLWTHVPVNFRSYDLGYTGALVWPEPPPKPGSNAVLIPYATGGVQEDKDNGLPWKATGNAGFDGKMALSSSLNLDMTVNPDFSQIEVDKQVTNLTRFNIFLPEKRTFFLENSSLFSSYGIPSVRPFYSRRIGLDKNGNKIPILLGVRLTGNASKSTRIGLLNMQTGSQGDYSAENYTAATINQAVLKRSTLNLYFMNRQGFLSDSAKKADPLSAYGRNLGGEFNYTNLKGTWNGWAGYHQSFKPGITKDDRFMDLGGSYNGRYFSAMLDMNTVGTNFYTDMGYTQRIENFDAARDTIVRLGYKQVYNEFDYRILPKKTKVSSYQFQLTNSFVFNPDNTLNERNQSLGLNIMYWHTAQLLVTLNNYEVNLLFPTAFTDKTPLPKDNYQYSQATLGYQSDFRKPLSYYATVGGGGFYNGSYQSFIGGVTWRSQPHLNIGLHAEYDKLAFPDIYGTAELFLIAPKVEINFSTAVFWTTFIQYNTQRNNFNINSRFQYRFKPMSDFFLVYTDNYYTDPLLKNRNRALVFKLNYWFSL